jgi:hypothetical protein
LALLGLSLWVGDLKGQTTVPNVQTPVENTQTLKPQYQKIQQSQNKPEEIEKELTELKHANLA